jgi:triosephosphate isomerase
MSLTPLVVGNWKMNTLASEVAAFASTLRIALEANREAIGDEVEVAIAPASLALAALGQALRDSGIGLAAQNVHAEASGAFTGEISVPMIDDLGCRYALIGHSERRQIFGELDAEIAQKALSLASSRITPILCIGETLEERERGATLDIVHSQLEAALEVLLENAKDGILGPLVVAYEPVWAIGTGRTATPEIAQGVHASIRDNLVARLGEPGRQIRLLYGGSVKPSSARELLMQPDINGALVGGASLEPEVFAEIILSALPASANLHNLENS